jgi:lipoate-protein ligase A
MAIDEAMLTTRTRNLIPNTIRFYCWKPSAVSIGKFQEVENEVQLENCKKNGVDVVRRITGGGAVYHDADGEITYSIVVSKRDLKTEDIAQVYRKIYSGIAEALEILGINTDFSEGNAKTCPNLTVEGKKISGSAQSHKRGIVLQHGTLLVDVDLKKMFTFLRVPWAKTYAEIANVAKHKITSIHKEIEETVSMKEVEQALVQGFQRTLKIELINGKLTPHESELAERLYREKYSTSEWNFHSKTG